MALSAGLVLRILILMLLDFFCTQVWSAFLGCRFVFQSSPLGKFWPFFFRGFLLSPSLYLLLWGPGSACAGSSAAFDARSLQLFCLTGRALSQAGVASLAFTACHQSHLSYLSEALRFHLWKFTLKLHALVCLCVPSCLSCSITNRKQSQDACDVLSWSNLCLSTLVNLA